MKIDPNTFHLIPESDADRLAIATLIRVAASKETHPAVSVVGPWGTQGLSDDGSMSGSLTFPKNPSEPVLDIFSFPAPERATLRLEVRGSHSGPEGGFSWEAAHFGLQVQRIAGGEWVPISSVLYPLANPK